MSIIVWELVVQDDETGQLYKTGKKFDHSSIADDIDDIVCDRGGIKESLDYGLLESIETQIKT